MTLVLCQQLSKAAEQQRVGIICGENGSSSIGIKPHPCKPRPVFLPSLSTSSINSDSSHASTEIQGLTDMEVKRNMTGGGGGESEPTANHHDAGVIPSGTSSVTVPATTVAPRSHSAISVENLTLSSSSSSNNGESRLGQELAFASSENLFAPLCNSAAHGIAGSSGVFGGVAAGLVSVPTSQPVSSSAYENCFPGSGGGVLNSTAIGAIGLSGLLSAPLASIAPLSVIPELEATMAKRQRSK